MGRIEPRANDADAVETAVLEGETAVACPHCDRPLPDEHLLALHLGREHAGRIDASEREAFEAADRAEEAALRRVRLLALAVVIATYFGLLFVYAVVA